MSGSMILSTGSAVFAASSSRNTSACEANIDAPRHDPEIDVGCHRPMTAPADNGAGLHGLESVQSGLEVRTGTSPSTKGLVERLVLPVRRMIVAAGRIGLPDLE